MSRYLELLECADRLGPALLAEFAKLSAHVEHLKGMLPLVRVRWL